MRNHYNSIEIFSILSIFGCSSTFLFTLIDYKYPENRSARNITKPATSQ